LPVWSLTPLQPPSPTPPPPGPVTTFPPFLETRRTEFSGAVRRVGSTDLDPPAEIHRVGSTGSEPTLGSNARIQRSDPETLEEVGASGARRLMVVPRLAMAIETRTVSRAPRGRRRGTGLGLDVRICDGPTLRKMTMDDPLVPGRILDFPRFHHL
jgi:hypothetical protein